RWASLSSRFGSQSCTRDHCLPSYRRFVRHGEIPTRHDVSDHAWMVPALSAFGPFLPGAVAAAQARKFAQLRFQLVSGVSRGGAGRPYPIAAQQLPRATGSARVLLLGSTAGFGYGSTLEVIGRKDARSSPERTSMAGTRDRRCRLVHWHS